LLGAANQSFLISTFVPLFSRLEPAVYAEDFADEVREQLLELDGVLVWVDPISQGQNRRQLDALLRDVASRGVWVSAHPDLILKMGVKEANGWPPPILIRQEIISATANSTSRGTPAEA
jgi:hypothetical protein